MATTQELLERLNTAAPPPAASAPVAGISAATRPLLDRLNAAVPPPEAPEGGLASSIIEPAQAIKRSLKSTIIGGLLGISAATNPFLPEGTGARVVRAAEEFGAGGAPKTKAGQESLQTIGTGVQNIVNALRLPASAVGGLIELVAGQGVDKSLETINSIINQGVGETGARRLLEELEEVDISPELKAFLATVVRVGPEATLELAGLKGGGAALKGTGQAAVSAVDTGSRAIARAPGKAVEAVSEAAGEIFKVQSPTKQKLAQRIASGDTGADTALFKLKEAIEDGAPRVETDTTAREAVNQGYDQGTVQAIKGASAADKKAMLEMLEIKEKGINNRLFEAKNRPSDIAGNALLNRYRIVFDANKKAGRELDGVANKLKTEDVDIAGPVRQFIEDLDSLDIKFGDDLVPNFDDSIIEGLAGPQRIINGIVKRMKQTKAPTAFDVHRLKRFIDEQVDFGKAGEGLTGRTEGVLKELRVGLDAALDGKFPEYDRVNTVYSETIRGIQAVQDVAGRKLNLTGRNADKAVGVLLRRLLSNAQSRERLLTAAEDLEVLAKKHQPPGNQLVRFGDKGKIIRLDDDVFVQTLFADELDAVFGPSGRTSFQGQIEQVAGRPIPTKESLLRSALKEAGRVGRGLDKVSQKNAFEIMRRLLEE